MAVLTDFDLDDDGKIDLNGIYDRPDPRDYYQTLVNLDYRVPGEAQPIFHRVIATLRAERDRREITALDVGSSYGVNGALLKHDFDLSELFDLYSPSATAGLSHHDLLRRDREVIARREGDPDLTVIGVDPAANAVGYACDAGFLDGGIVSDLETGSPTEADAALLADVDLVISTGAIGYVGAPTFEQILNHARSRPWFALFALRMFSIESVAALLRDRGYDVFRLAGSTFRQRRFAGKEEAAEVIANLEQQGIDPSGLESEGWYHAECFFARPANSMAEAPIKGLVRI